MPDMTTRSAPPKRLPLAAAALLAIVAVAPAVQAASDPNAMAIKYRQSAYTVLVAQFGYMGAVVGGKMPYDAKAFQVRADRSVVLGQILPEVFPVGSDKGAPTEAKPEIWQKQAEFKKLLADTQDKLGALAKAAASGNLETIKPVYSAAADSCKACHKQFKND
jgi:cytochrome c556